MTTTGDTTSQGSPEKKKPETPRQLTLNKLERLLNIHNISYRTDLDVLWGVGVVFWRGWGVKARQS